MLPRSQLDSSPMVHAPVEEQQLFLGTKYFVRVVQR
jgi:hypothetical protein